MPHQNCVVVVHPQAQHSFQLARALYDSNLLRRFYTSLFFERKDTEAWPTFIRTRIERRTSDSISADKVRRIVRYELLWQLYQRMLTGDSRVAKLHSLWHAYDCHVASLLRREFARVVVGFENSCLAVFIAAKRQGAVTVLDAPSLHFGFQQRAQAANEGRWRDVINARKAQEIELADRIVVLSDFAKETYLEAGVPARKIHVIAPGTDVPQFSVHPTKTFDHFRYLFVGNLSHHKGLDLLLDAFAALSVPGKTLVIVGGGEDSRFLKTFNATENVRYRGRLNNAELSAEYLKADVLVLPSRIDGFGLVVLESLAHGTPVIVSSAVGAKQVIQDTDLGWIFPAGNLDALIHCMNTAYVERHTLRTHGQYARALIEHRYTWSSYRARITNFYRDLLTNTSTS